LTLLLLAFAVVPWFQRVCLEKEKAHVNQHFWHVGFGISLFSAVLGPQQPQARNVCFATATALAAATTHGLAGHSHYVRRVRGVANRVNAVCARKKVILASDNLDAGAGRVVMRRKIEKGY
jgi:hypothetical protein